MKKHSIRWNVVLRLVLIIIFFTIYIFLIDQDKAKRIEQNILNFNIQYKEYLDKDVVTDKKELEKLIEEKYSSSSELRDYYHDIQEKTFENVEKDYLQQVYKFNLYRTMNTTNFSESSKKRFQDAIKESELLIKDLNNNYELDKLRSLKSQLDRFDDIVSKEYNQTKLITNAYIDASKNNNTSSQVDNDCFNKQNNRLWKYEAVATDNFCKALGLNNCLNINKSTLETNSSIVYGYTRNNPKKVNDTKHKYYDYVTYNDTSFLRHEIKMAVTVANSETMHVEVYSQTINNQKVYKYNVVVLDKDYSLSCDTP
ncbi:hypothetical protein [Mycoplasma sp. P36-A1]|uniref:hypothetical protein n=1 Tax=Mycoplasma sp. P36-A1 TaxID=3252900 RepID=UPI003C2EA9BE